MELFTQVISYVLAIFALILFILLIIRVFLLWVMAVFENIVMIFFDKPFLIHFDLFPRSAGIELETFLHLNIPFYRNLTEKNQQVFARRVRHFVRVKAFETREDLDLTDEMMTMIAANAVRLTFGLREYILKSFGRIIIYPEPFYSGFLQTEVKGETIDLGYILFSWKDFNLGNEIPDDKINLGLHEFAHALAYEAEENSMDIHFCHYYNNFMDYAFQDHIQMELKDSGFIRDYGFTNSREFFSVITEVFFENPDELNQKFPNLYWYLAKMYYQDPVRRFKRL